MIHFMVDFENVRNAGMRGCEYLHSDDQVTIFFSKECPNIEQGRMQQMMASGCLLDICKLHKTGKNALDFYIASRIGEVMGRGYQGIIVIVSNDKGFLAVRDYWQTYSDGREVVIRPDMEQGILISGEASERQKIIQNNHRNISIEAEFEKYKERRRIQQALEQLFSDTKYQDRIEKIMDVVQTEKKPKLLYLDSLKKFGRQDGTCIYNKLKQII